MVQLLLFCLIRKKGRVLETVEDFRRLTATTVPDINNYFRCNRGKVREGPTDNCHPADIVMTGGMDPLLAAAASGFAPLVGIHLKCKNVNTQDVFGRTALHLAVLCGHIDVIHILLKHMAKLDMKDIFGHTPLCYAVWQRYTAIVELLVNVGATLNDKHCLLHCSVKNGDYDIVKLLLTIGANPNLFNSSDETPLMIAAMGYDIPVASILLQYGAKPHLSNHFRCITPLHLLVTNELHKEENSTLFEAFVNLLIKYEVDLNAGGPDVRTPLRESLFLGKYKSAQYLIQMGADVNKMPLGWQTPSSNLGIAFRRNQFPLVKLMVAAGYDLEKGCLDLLLSRYENSVVDRDSPMGWLLAVKCNPCSLTEICRLKIRKDLGSTVSTVVPNFNIPKTLKRFLMLEGISNADNIKMQDITLS